jgi:hypothetical protein
MQELTAEKHVVEKLALRIWKEILTKAALTATTCCKFTSRPIANFDHTVLVVVGEKAKPVHHL